MTNRSTDPVDVSPHEILGLPAGERDPVKIVEAAALRLEALESAGGSEMDVRRSLARLIRSARDAMLGADPQP